MINEEGSKILQKKLKEEIKKIQEDIKEFEKEQEQ